LVRKCSCIRRNGEGFEFADDEPTACNLWVDGKTRNGTIKYQEKDSDSSSSSMERLSVLLLYFILEAL
jgi:hypothetical protein